jgi:prefoldin subunit 5
MPPVATELDLATESTSEPPRPQPFADTDEHEVPSMCDQLKRKRKAPERFEVGDLRSFATGKRRSAHSCCPSHMDTEPSTSEPAPKPKFTGPMDKYLSDKRVEAAVNRAVKSITDNPADLERELRDFAQAGEDWRQKSMSLEQENEAIQKKLDKVTKELEKVKKEAAREIGNFNDAEDHQAILKAIVGNGYKHDESGRRLLRMHAAAIVEKIQATAKGDLLGQMQLAEAVKRRLSPANFEPDKDLYVALAIAESKPDYNVRAE